MTAERRSPLAGWQDRFDAVPADVRIAELPFRGQLNLRTGSAGAHAVARVLGAALPVEACTAVRVGEHDVLWLGPDEWLIVTTADVAALAAELRAALAGGRGSVVDVSAQRTVLRLTGDGARDLLAKGCSIDLHPAQSPPGTCVQTLLAQTGVIVVVGEDGMDGYLLVVRASFAPYLAAWLVDAGMDAEHPPAHGSSPQRASR